MLIFLVFYSNISNLDLLDHSYLWLLNKIENSYFESEMEVASIIMRFLNIHGESLQPNIIDLVVNCVRVTCLKEYYVTQILPVCEYFKMSKEKISAVLEYQKNGTESPLLPKEWCLPPREIDQSAFGEMVSLLNWSPFDTNKQDFIQKKHPGTVDISPIFINFLGVKMVPKLTFHAPNVIVDITAVFCDMNEDECTLKVEKINCDFVCFIRKGDRERKYSGIFSESSVSLSCNIMEWTDYDPFKYFEYLKEVSVLIFFKRFD